MKHCVNKHVIKLRLHGVYHSLGKGTGRGQSNGDQDGDGDRCCRNGVGQGQVLWG